jgi:aminoglycoside phosphotransferase (APT) family kinase protein
MDKAKDIRPGEELKEKALQVYLQQYWPGHERITDIKQFPGGYSNLTYALSTNQGEYVLRRPPFGANIKSAHDMGREFRVLNLLQPHYNKIPQPVLMCENTEVIGAPFYLMERVQGVILRNQVPKDLDLTPARMRALSEATVDNLAALHAIDIEATGLIDLGKPEGYIERQVTGWIKRYRKAETDTVASMDALTEWLPQNQPPDGAPGLIHNDYKYDNLVLDPNDLSHIKAVLDWEMCTVGDPLMDLGTTLAYWINPGEENMLTQGVANLTWLPGNLTREEVVERYAMASGRNLDDISFYFAFGAFKIGVILQQIYKRYKEGHTQDPRFAFLIELVKVFGKRGIGARSSGSS